MLQFNFLLQFGFFENPTEHLSMVIYLIIIFHSLQLDPMELNNTRKAKKDILFFNRVPKVAVQDLSLYLTDIVMIIQIYI